MSSAPPRTRSRSAAGGLGGGSSCSGPDGYQLPILTGLGRVVPAALIACSMLARWRQENLALAIEVDGFEFHENDPAQQVCDSLKNAICAVYGIPFRRLPTTGSGEADLIRTELDTALRRRSEFLARSRRQQEQPSAVAHWGVHATAASRRSRGAATTRAPTRILTG